MSEQPNKMLPGVYTASKVIHAPTWRSLREGWSFALRVTSRWIDTETFDGPGVDASVKRAGWIVDEQDVRDSDYILVASLNGEDLRGALVEAGMGIALGKKIVLCGESQSFGTWQEHPLVVAKCKYLTDALAWIVADWKGEHTRHG